MGESASEDGDANERERGSTRDRLERFEWPAGVLTGMGAFVGNYVLMGLLLVLLTVVSSVNFPGSSTTRLTRLGFLLYNAHGIVIVPETTGNVVALPFNLLQSANQPLLYQAVPVLGLLGTSGALTYWRRPERRDGIDAIATGLAMTLGYLLFALLGTYLFATTQQGVTFHPGRLETLVRGLLYPLVTGTIGSLVGQGLYVGAASADET